MGRAFEYRKEKKFKRWGMMAKTFTKIGKEIAMSVKAGGPDPASNPRLRLAMQNAKTANMPKDRVEAAIKRVTSKDEKDYEEVVYEGYGPFGIAIVIDCATDNPTRTVANIRSYFNRADGALGKTGSLDFLFERKGVFKISAQGQEVEELEFELIDYGADEVFEDDGEIFIYTAFNDFGTMQKALEERNIEVLSAESQRIPNTTTKIEPSQALQIQKLLEKIEEDDDVQTVSHNMDESSLPNEEE
jgi:YebC/PmpR family DNA-binding regulatory protein